MEGRTSNFYAGTKSARTIQTGAGVTGYRPRSVLDSIARSGIGSSASDRGRILPTGGMLRSPNGSSATTWNRQTWLESPYRPLE